MQNVKKIGIILMVGMMFLMLAGSSHALAGWTDCLDISVSGSFPANYTHHTITLDSSNFDNSPRLLERVPSVTDPLYKKNITEVINDV